MAICRAAGTDVEPVCLPSAMAASMQDEDGAKISTRERKRFHSWRYMPMMSNAKSALGAVAALALTFGAAYIGSRFPVDAWYAALSKPAWNPPNWLFGPVWTVLYLLMALAAWLIWRKGNLMATALPLGLFVLQLALNAAWSWIFFGLHQLGLALVEILILWVAILATIAAFWRLNPASGWLMIPYLLWVTFASALNFVLWRLNM
jgi:benzodiazapine receptor